ncbi:uncharacterized protein AMSG_01745 [Thecamonas trahens ATCC 50062]|uniref:Palmitoyltransferase n=1 Tax=Thecamonas trahens ATCC 50062 TaxID=461836 RepID=A0A0L0DTV7_THETB|nr:hypothetical protein AMSG_01745 [Thecamonas trahens ATCC 50062]KNC55481.1 hypothetical protein AMSG_01745 [Thecamonas trahens ATCC 50062]|eukprot:XP_013761261.1 hypothetical protein AMSG_01745 [Thecamonas trahens ATCC 50062]
MAIDLARYGRWERICRLESGDASEVCSSSGETVLHIAVTSAHPPSRKQFRTLLRLCAQVIDAKAGSSSLTPAAALCLAAGKDSPHAAGMLAELVVAGASVTARSRGGETLLHCAAACNAFLLLRLLVCSATVPEGRKLLNAKDGAGRTPLAVAAAAGHREALDVLIVAKADLDALVAAGARLRIQDEVGESALDVAVRLAQAEARAGVGSGEATLLATYLERIAGVPVGLRDPDVALDDGMVSLEAAGKVAAGLGFTLTAVVAALMALGGPWVLVIVPLGLGMMNFVKSNRNVISHPRWVPAICCGLISSTVAFVSTWAGYASTSEWLMWSCGAMAVLISFLHLVTSPSGVYLAPRFRTPHPGFPFSTTKLSLVSPALDEMPGEIRGAAQPIDMYAWAPPTLVAGYCQTCDAVRPLRAKHCARCRGCVPAMDHHCDATGTCVGAGNHGPFYVFLLLTTAYTLAALVHLVPRTRLGAVAWWATVRSGTLVSSSLDNVSWVELSWPMWNSLVLVFGFVFAGAIWFSQTWFISRNELFNEVRNGAKYRYLRNSDGQKFNPFDEGVAGNWWAFVSGADRSFPATLKWRLKAQAMASGERQRGLHAV